MSDIYDYVQTMLTAERYLPPPVSLAGRHFQRYIVDTTEDPVNSTENSVGPVAV